MKLHRLLVLYRCQHILGSIRQHLRSNILRGFSSLFVLCWHQKQNEARNDCVHTLIYQNGYFVLFLTLWQSDHSICPTYEVLCKAWFNHICDLLSILHGFNPYQHLNIVCHPMHILYISMSTNQECSLFLTVVKPFFIVADRSSIGRCVIVRNRTEPILGPRKRVIASSVSKHVLCNYCLWWLRPLYNI